MCGIAGFITKKKDPNHRKWLEGMAAIMYHRGPDGFGFYQDDELGLYLGHARLSIIDLEHGHQPLINQANGNAMIVNGEFYNYQEIRANLKCRGFEFTTKSDSEIALYLYDQYGLDFVRHLRGEFAVCLYDRAKKRLILVRDRFGVRPIFYHFDKKGSFYFGSEIKSLMANPNVPRRFSSRALVHQTMQTMVPGTSAFDEIYAVKPGHMLIIEEVGTSYQVTEKCYWDLEFPEEQDHQYQQDENVFVELTREKLIDAVKERLIADVPVGCYLSGGIDSCSILGMATSLEQESLRAYTISFDHDDYDESIIAKEMASKANAEQIILNLTSKDLYQDNFVNTVWHSERTFYNTLGVAKWHMSKKVHENKDKVVITGEGSDELFGGYPGFKLDFALHDQKRFGSQAEKILETNKLFVGHILSEKKLNHPGFEDICGFTPSWIQPWMMTWEQAKQYLADDVKLMLQNYDPIANIIETFDVSKLKNRHPLDQSQYAWSKTMLECQILNWGGDRVDMANSMESRPAFLDHHVAEVAFHIPPNIRIKNGVEKWVLREAMKGILPEVLYQREKFAFMAPPAHTDIEKQKMITELMDQYLTDDKIKEVGFFSVKELNQFKENCFHSEHKHLATRNDSLLNHILGIHILHDLFIKRDVPELGQKMRKEFVKS